MRGTDLLRDQRPGRTKSLSFRRTTAGTDRSPIPESKRSSSRSLRGSTYGPGMLRIHSELPDFHSTRHADRRLSGHSRLPSQAHRTALEPKPDGWGEQPENKREEMAGKERPGSYQWFEIQDSRSITGPHLSRPKSFAAREPAAVQHWPRPNTLPGKHRLNHPRAGASYLVGGSCHRGRHWFFISKTAQPLRLRSDRWQYRLISSWRTSRFRVPRRQTAKRSPPWRRSAVAGSASSAISLKRRSGND